VEGYKLSESRPEPIIQYPDFDEIKKRAKEKIDKMFDKYENSWKDEALTLDWWKKRLLGELDEIFESKKLSAMSEEILDLIIVACMMYDRLVLVTCAKCGKFLTNWRVMDGQPHCDKCYFGYER